MKKENTLKDAIKNRKEKEKQELRSFILKAAAELFLEHGYENFSLRKLAQRIEYSATTIYLYFHDKDDLLYAVLDQGFDIFEKMLIEAVTNNKAPLKKLEALGNAYIKFGIENQIYYQFMFMQKCDYLMTPKQGEEKPRLQTLDILNECIKELIDKGFFNKSNSVEELSNIMWALMHGLVSLKINMPELVSREIDKVADIAFKNILNGLLIKE